MENIKDLLIIVNNGLDKPKNQYASYVVAFMSKQIAKIERVTIYYGPSGVEMSKQGNLASLKITDDIKDLIASQLEGVTKEALPDNLELLARFVNQLGVNIVSCATFDVIDGISKNLEDTSHMEDFIMPVKLPQAAQALLGADKIIYF